MGSYHPWVPGPENADERINLVVLFGGQSAEHDVSRVTAAHVLRAIDPARYRVTAVGITRDGEWQLAAGAMAELASGADTALTDGLAVEGAATSAAPVLSASQADGRTVVLPLLQSEVVPPGWVTNDAFLAGYGAAQAVPGPLFTFAAYLGAIMGPEPNGWVGALLATAAIFLPAFLLTIGILPFWDGLRGLDPVRSALTGVNAAVVGLLLAALYHPVWTSAIEAQADFGKADRRFLVDAKRAAKVEIALGGDIALFQRHLDCGRHRFQGHAGAGDQRFQQHVARTKFKPGAAGRRMQAGHRQRASGLDLAGDAFLVDRAFGFQGNDGGGGV